MNDVTNWHVYINGKLVDYVSYARDCDEQYVKRTLIDYNGFPTRIEVKKVKYWKEGMGGRYEGLDLKSYFGFCSPPCPDILGFELFEKCGLPRFYYVDGLTSPNGFPLRSKVPNESGGWRTEPIWGEIPHQGRNEWREPLPYGVSKILSECNANELSGVCDDHNLMLERTCSFADYHFHTTIWVCPPNLVRIALALFELLKAKYAARRISDHYYCADRLELTKIHYVFIRRACIAGQSDIDHAAIWNSFYLLLKEVGMDRARDRCNHYKMKLVSEFHAAISDIEECYGPVCGHKKGELWTEVKKFEGLWSGRWTNDAITEEMARYPDLYPLSKFSSIEDDAAAVLMKSIPVAWDVVVLDGLAELSDTASEHLGRCGTDLDLCGLTNLSVTAAKNLSNVYGGLRFDSLTSISDEAAKSLANHKGKLILNGLTRLSDEAAEGLSAHEESLELCGVFSLSDEAVESLSKIKGSIYLGITELSDAAANSLAKHEGKLSLHGLKTISDRAADALKSHAGSLFLDGLLTISDAAAKSLSKLSGRSLSLRMLTNLSGSAAVSLGGFNGSIWLNGLTNLSDEAADGLSYLEGSLFLDGLTSLTDEAATSLSTHGHLLSLLGLKDISDVGAEALAYRAYENKRVIVDWKKLPTSAAEIFNKRVCQ